MQSVSMARIKAVRRSGTLSPRKKKAKGALDRVKALDKLKIEFNLGGFFNRFRFFLCPVFYTFIPNHNNYSYRES